MRCGRFTSPHLARYNERICVDGVEATDAEPDRLVRAHRRGARRHHADFLRIQRARGARSVSPRAASTWRCSKWGWAAGWTPPTSSTPTSPWCAPSASITSTGWATRSRRSAARRPASSGAGRPAVLGSAEMPRVGVRAAIEEVGARPWCPAAIFACARTAAQDLGFRLRRVALRGSAVARARGPHQLGNAATALAALAVGGFGVDAHDAIVAPG